METWPAAEQSTGAKTAQGSRPSSGPARTAPELTSPEAGSSGRGSPARSREGPAVPGAAERVPEARGVVVLRLRPPRGGSDSVELVAGSGREPRFRTGVRRKWWCCASAAGLWELGRAPTARRGPRPGVALSAALLPPTQPSPGGVQSVRSRGGGGPARGSVSDLQVQCHSSVGASCLFHRRRSGDPVSGRCETPGNDGAAWSARERA